MIKITHLQYREQEYHGSEQEILEVYTNDWINQSKVLIPQSKIELEDPAVVNPDELATFPKQVSAENIYRHHHESHLVNKRTPVRNGRNITRTDNHPDKNGFM